MRGHTQNSPGILEQFPRIPAALKELVPAHGALMRRHMAGSPSIRPDDQRTRRQMFGLTLAKHGDAGRAAIADDLPSKYLFKRCDHVRRKPVWIQRPGNVRGMTGYFPITGYGIQALRKESKTTETPFRLPHHPHTFDACNMAKPERFQRGEVESANGIRQMGQGIGTGIAVFRRIGHGPDTETIDYQHNHTSNHARTIAEARGTKKF